MHAFGIVMPVAMEQCCETRVHGQKSSLSQTKKKKKKKGIIIIPSEMEQLC